MVDRPRLIHRGYWGVFGADAFADFFQGGHASMASLRSKSRSPRAAPSRAIARKGCETIVPGIAGHASLG
jgi:hypothetical protein